MGKHGLHVAIKKTAPNVREIAVTGAQRMQPEQEEKSLEAVMNLCLLDGEPSKIQRNEWLTTGF